MRAIGRDAEASGTRMADVVVAFCEAATAAGTTGEPPVELRAAIPFLVSLLEAFDTARDTQREAVGHLLHLQEEERSRLAAEVHDDAIQAVAAAYMRLQLLARRLTSPADRESCEALERVLRQSVQRLRRLTFELRPLALEDATLAGALHHYLSQVEFEDHVGFQLVDSLVTEPCEQGRLVLYRAAQELTNDAKHAGASSVAVALSEDPAGFTLRIEDDGRAFRTAAHGQRGLGLRFVRERAEAIGGSCRVESRPKHGTSVQVWVPRR
jgi:signal transduction histidine kinase